MRRVVDISLLSFLNQQTKLLLDFQGSIIMHGPSHSGKTTIGKLIADITNSPIMTENLVALPCTWKDTREAWYKSQQRTENLRTLKDILNSRKFVCEGWGPSGMDTCLYIHINISWDEINKRSKLRNDTHPEAYLKDSFDNAGKSPNEKNLINYNFEDTEQVSIANSDDKETEEIGIFRVLPRKGKIPKVLENKGQIVKCLVCHKDISIKNISSNNEPWICRICEGNSWDNCKVCNQSKSLCECKLNREKMKTIGFFRM